MAAQAGTQFQPSIGPLYLFLIHKANTGTHDLSQEDGGFTIRDLVLIERT